MAFNVKYEVTKDDLLVVTVDLKQRGDLSASWKTLNVGSTGGFLKLDGKHADVSFAVNATTKTGVKQAAAKAIKEGRTPPDGYKG